MSVAHDLGRTAALELEGEEAVVGADVEAALAAHVGPGHALDDRAQVEPAGRDDARRRDRSCGTRRSTRLRRAATRGGSLVDVPGGGRRPSPTARARSGGRRSRGRRPPARLTGEPGVEDLPQLGLRGGPQRQRQHVGVVPSRAPCAVAASAHSAARTPGTLLAAIDAPVPVQQQTTACSARPSATSRAAASVAQAQSSRSPSPSAPCRTGSCPRSRSSPATASATPTRSSAATAMRIDRV